jgi:aprataxin
VATKERAETLNPGSSVVVPLPSTSPLYQREGVTHVIHVLGPNMNPQRPNYLNNDYTKGSKILRDTYSSLFENFASITCPERNKKQKITEIKEKILSEESNTKEKQKGAKSRNWGSWALALYNTAKDPEKHKDDLLEISDNLVVLNDLYPKVFNRNLYFSTCLPFHNLHI